MSHALPTVFIALGGAGLLVAFFFVWQSLRAAFGVRAPAQVGADGADAGPETDRSRDELKARQEALLEGLRDVMFDRDAGKLTEQDYEEQAGLLRAEVKQVMRKLDEGVAEFREAAEALVAGAASTQGQDAGDASAKDAASKGSGGRNPKSKKRKKVASGEKAAEASTDSEAAEGGETADAARERRRKKRRSRSSGEWTTDDRLLCPQCMAPNDPDDEKCKECKARIAPMMCAACNTENDADATFCKKCGKQCSLESADT